ncbi:MAG: DJ-1/PfpI family protein [Thermoguttaceae bacterium]
MKKPTPGPVTRRGMLGVSLGAAAALAAGTATAGAESWRKGSLQGKKVLVGIGEFSEGMETYYMVYRLKEEGILPVVAAAQVKAVKTVVHDFEPQYSNYTEKPGYLIQADIAYKDVNPADYDGMLIPGGRGPEEMRQLAEVLKIVRYFLDRTLPLGTMCHGPQVVWAAGPVKGRKMACYHAIRPDLELAGAEFVDRGAVVDGALVTSRGWPDLWEFMPAFLEVLAAAG